jgi:hypothetical protein
MDETFKKCLSFVNGIQAASTANGRAIINFVDLQQLWAIDGRPPEIPPWPR